MRKPEQKKIEPSIEEILASIRKIIAEDGLPENAPEGSYEQTDSVVDLNGPYPASQGYDFGSFGGNNEISQEICAPVRDKHINGGNVERAASFPQPKMSSQEYDQTSDEDLIYIDDAEVSEPHEFDNIAYSQSAPFQKESFNPNAYYQALEERFATIEDEILELTEDFMIEEPNDDGSQVELDFSVVVSQIATISAGKPHDREEFCHEVTEPSPSLLIESEEEIEVELLSEPEPDTAKQELHHTATASEEEGSTSALGLSPQTEELNDALASVVAEMRRLSEGQISKAEIEDTPISSPSEQELSDDSAVSQPITFNAQTTTPQRPVWSARCLDNNDNQDRSTDATEDETPAQLTEPKSTETSPSHLSIAEEIMAMGNPMALAMEMSHFPNFNDKRVAQEEQDSETLAPPVPNTSLARHAKLKNSVEPPSSAFALPEIEEEIQPQDFCDKPQCQTVTEPLKDSPKPPIKKNCQAAEDTQDSPRANLEEVSNIANPAALPQSVEEKAPAMPATNSLKAEVSKIDTPATTELEAKVREILKPLFQEWLDEKLPHILSRVIADLQRPDT